MQTNRAVKLERSYKRTARVVEAVRWCLENILASALCAALALLGAYAAYRFVLWTGATATLSLWAGIAALLFGLFFAVLPCSKRVQSGFLAVCMVIAPFALAVALAILIGYAARSFWLGIFALAGFCAAVGILISQTDFEYDPYCDTVKSLLCLLLSLLAAFAAGMFLYRRIEPHSYGIAGIGGFFTGAFFCGLLWVGRDACGSPFDRIEQHYDPEQRMKALLPTFGEEELAALVKESSYDSVRAGAMLRLIESADSGALAEYAKAGTYSVVAARAFARILEADDREAIVGCAANSKHARVREDAAKRHMEFAERGTLLAYAKDGEFCSAAERAIRRLVETDDREAIVDCAKNSRHAAVRSQAEHCHIPFAGRETLLDYAKNSEFSYEAEQAFERLVETNDAEAITDCAEHSAHINVRNAATMYNAASVSGDALLRLAMETEYQPAAEKAAERLAAGGDCAALRECSASGKFSTVRRTTARALVELVDLPELMDNVHHAEFPDVRERALLRIAEIAAQGREETVTAQAVALIEVLLDGEDQRMRLAAARAAKVLFGASMLQSGQIARLDGRQLVARVDEDHSYSDDNCECGHDDYTDYTDIASEYLRF